MAETLDAGAFRAKCLAQKHESEARAEAQRLRSEAYGLREQALLLEAQAESREADASAYRAMSRATALAPASSESEERHG